MNDYRENQLIENHLFSKSETFMKNIESELKNWNLKCCVLSLGVSCADNIPMWSMYGNNFNGVCLAMKINEKSYNYHQINKIDKDKKILLKCEYKTLKQIKKIASELHKKFQSNSNKVEVIQEIALASCAIKRCCFEYEKEVRFVEYSNDLQYKIGRYGMIG